MNKTLIILTVIALFISITFMVWKLSKNRYNKEFGEKRRKLFGQNTFYWESVIGISTAITFLIVFILKQTSLLPF